MKNIIKELYYGNIDPQARGFQKGSYLQAFANASNIVLGESELDSFLVGFRLGARFAYDTFVDNSAPYCDFLKEEFE